MKKGFFAALAAMSAALMGTSRGDRMNRDPQAARHGKSKGGRKGKGTTPARARFAPPRPGDGKNWHRMNRASWRDTPGHENHTRAKGWR